MKVKSKLFLLLTIFSLTSPILSWTDHFFGTYYALTALPTIAEAKPVKAESLESFLNAESANLKKLTDEIEETVRKELEYYPPRPVDLSLNVEDKANLKINFLRSLRINPTLKCNLFIQELPTPANLKKKSIPVSMVSIFEDDEWMKEYVFTEIKEGSPVKPIDITATAADEPDYGLDINLFTDSETAFGTEYSFGVLPFGNPKYYYSTQAPFHMGFYHESGIVYAAAAFVKQTYPEMRVIQFTTLARHAFKTGHDYWGYRFLGWAMHYIGDLTQPYHSTLVPGVSTGRLLWINTKAMIGFDGDKKETVERVSDRHTAIEHYQYDIMRKAIESSDDESKFLKALTNRKKDNDFPTFDFRYVRQAVSLESHERAGELDQIIENSAEIMKFKESEKNIQYTPNETTQVVDDYLIGLFESFGSHMRKLAGEIAPKPVEKN
ncbi:MAG: phospholipase [Leptospiraceae bacterium]|nr:phospholipase [Leptospiraceae bacterium]